MTLRDYFNKGIQNKADVCEVYNKHGKYKIDVQKNWDAEIIYEDIRFMVGSHRTLLVLRANV